MSIYNEKAKELGELILKSDQAISVNIAREALESDEDAKRKLLEYTAYQTDIQRNISKGNMTEEQYKLAIQKLTEMGAELKKHPLIGTLIFAENEFNAFINQVMNVLKSVITGIPAEESNCGGCQGGSCSSCG